MPRELLQTNKCTLYAEVVPLTITTGREFESRPYQNGYPTAPHREVLTERTPNCNRLAIFLQTGSISKVRVPIRSGCKNLMRDSLPEEVIYRAIPGRGSGNLPALCLMLLQTQQLPLLLRQLVFPSAKDSVKEKVTSPLRARVRSFPAATYVRDHS